MNNLSGTPPLPGDTIVAAAVKVLTQPDPALKAEFTNVAVHLWRSGQLQWPSLDVAPAPPQRPARSDDKVRVVARHLVPDPGKGAASHTARLHSLVHIENWAIDLSWDIIARFGADAQYGALPRAFFDDWVTVAEDECRHFLLLQQRLEALGLHYGYLPVHDGLWDAAENTAHSLPARLAVEHCVHEARGLDVLPATIRRFRGGGDPTTATLLETTVYPEEVSHCAAGVRWLKFLHRRAHGASEDELDDACSPAAPGDPGAFLTLATTPCTAADAPALSAVPPPPAAGSSAASDLPGGAAAADALPSSSWSSSSPSPPSEATATAAAAGAPEAGWAAEARRFERVQDWFCHLVRNNYRGGLKPPFNVEARARAGFGADWYLPLVTPPAARVPTSVAVPALSEDLLATAMAAAAITAGQDSTAGVVQCGAA